MNVIACIDNNNGIAFNGRRVSSDLAVMSRIKFIVGDHKLWVDKSSEKLLQKHYISYEIIDKNSRIREEDYVFIDTKQFRFIKKDCSNIDTLVLFMWNRDYPSDTKLDIDMSVLKEYYQLEYKGFSHEKINELHFNKKGKLRNEE